MKSMLWTGAVVALIGVVVLAVFVVPYVGSPDPKLGLNGLPQGTLPAWAVVVSSAALAVGFTLIGIGVGRWQHPRHSHTLPLGQTRHGSEV